MNLDTPNQHLRPYGVGLAYRYVVHDDVLEHRDEVDLLEISTEDYLVRQRLVRYDPDQSKLREIASAFPCVAHGLSLSLGSVQAPNERYLDATRRFLEDHDLTVFSEHLAYHQMDGTDLTMFLGMPFEESAILWLKRAYYHARRALGRPFALENVTYPFPVPHCPLNEADFFRRLTDETDCSFLLDVTNLFNNAQNHGYDAGEFLDRYPLERVTQIHLAGGYQKDDGQWEDSHSEAVMPPVWTLFEEVIRRTKAEIVILERDSKFHPFETVRDDLSQAREIFCRHRPEKPQGPLREFAGPPEAEVPPPEATAPEFHDLRAFQRSILALLTRSEFREAFRADPGAAVARAFDLRSPAWLERLRDCDRNAMHGLTERWETYHEEHDLDHADYEQREWAAWAAQLEKEGAR